MKTKAGSILFLALLAAAFLFAINGKPIAAVITLFIAFNL